jgi:type I restriction enzyme S subunit
MKGIFFALPPVAEQLTILAFLDEATRSANEAIDRMRREIRLLHEFRARLIADVVTGKLDARAAAAGLPEITEVELINDLADADDLDDAVDDVENEEAAA